MCSIMKLYDYIHGHLSDTVNLSIALTIAELVPILAAGATGEWSGLTDYSPSQIDLYSQIMSDTNAGATTRPPKLTFDLTQTWTKYFVTKAVGPACLRGTLWWTDPYHVETILWFNGQTRVVSFDCFFNDMTPAISGQYCLLACCCLTPQQHFCQLYHVSDMMYEMRRRKHEPTLLLIQEIFNLSHHIGMVFDDAVKYTQWGNGLQHHKMLWQWRD